MNAEALRRQILQLEQSLLSPEVRLSAQRVEELIADEFVEFCSSGKVYRYSRGDIFHTPAQGRIEDFALRSLSPDCALATYRFVRTDGAVSLRSSVWQRLEGAWKMMFHQGTPERQSGPMP